MAKNRASVMLWAAIALILSALFSVGSTAYALSVNVAGPNGEAVGGFRWIIEEDTTYRVSPGTIDPDTLSVRFHTSYAPPAAKGDHTLSSNIGLDPAKAYYVSVMPDSGYALGGAPVAPGQASVTVRVNKLPIPTAQISVLVFEDNQPINNAPNLPAEKGLQGFSIILSDTAGRYGMSGGQMMKDAFGNPLGTTYDAAGNVLKIGNGIIKTDATGRALIKYLPPGKYGIRAVPPAGQGWVQTSTIEGTRTIDAWVKANEPPFFTEFGPVGQHVAVGFIRPFADARSLTGGKTLTGRVVNLHLSAPPFSTFNNGGPMEHVTPWVGLNELQAGVGKGIFARRANPDGTFSIPNVPAGTYQLVVWDENLDLLIGLAGVTVTAGGGTMPLGDVQVFQWFSRLESRVFYDRNQNGFRDCATITCDNPALDDVGMPDVPLNIRFRDGSMYQTAKTDASGSAQFDEVFPFFNWLVAEVDFARLKATGATVIVDAGGPVTADQGWANPTRGVLTPQPQFDPLGNPAVNPNTGNNLSRTETGAVLLQAFQGFLGQTNVIEWGKSAYGPGENGGISGIVYYATTRAENDPRYAAADPWEPGIPRVQVNLYKDADNDGAIDDANGDGKVTLSDIDNHPFGWAAGGRKGPEDVERSGANGVFDLGDAVQFTYTDSFDDNKPVNCQGAPFTSYGVKKDCFDGLRKFNQVRPGVFDGGYAFPNVVAGTYMVEAAPPRSGLGQTYSIVKEEDKNVDFGESYKPSTMLLPPVCVDYDENNGRGHLVPAELALFPGVPSAFAGKYRPLCDRKQIRLNDGANAAVDFFMFTEVPVAGHIKGMVLDDTANEFDPNSPQFGEKFAPPWLPVSIKDWTGREISRTYTDKWGAYNALVPSTYTVNVPSPTGVSPQMLTACLNDPGPIPDPANPAVLITDPYFSRQYSQFCYTFQYMPGTTTYLDTPVVPVAAFAGPNQFPLDCEFPDGTPKVYSVSGPNGSGPYISAPGQRITIVSEGLVSVPNPAYDGPNGVNPITVKRDYGFGTVAGTVSIGGTPLQINAWTAGSIVATVPAGAKTGELSVTRGDNKKGSITALTVTVGPFAGTILSVTPGGSIQAAIDLARPGDMIMVPPGTYNEMIFMWKPVALQGWGSAATIINGSQMPGDRLVLWRQKLGSLVASGSVDLLPAQLVPPPGGGPFNFPEEGAAITVLARNAAQASGGFGPSPNARIDGLTLTGASTAGGVLVNGYAHYLEISNNRIMNNQGINGGGVRIGYPNLTTGAGVNADYQNGFNDHVRVHNNHITQNGGLGGFGGGVSISTGSDFYEVTDNYVCGNFTLGSGGGIGHHGLSNSGLIARNKVLFNQSFNQGVSVSGGGIIVTGGAPLVLGGLSPGSGSVKIVSNRIQGNLAGAGDGGGIRLNSVNGKDVNANKTLPDAWYRAEVLNNVIVNNVAGLAGGGISLQDAARVSIIHNTIANNDSTATASDAFPPANRAQSNPQPAGIVARAHSDALAAAFGAGTRVAPYKEFSNPYIADNIIWHNRSFYFLMDATQNPPTYELVPNMLKPGTQPVYWDLWVLGTALPRFLNPQYSILTDRTGYNVNNLSVDPGFTLEYSNGTRHHLLIPEVTTAMQTMPAFDEGGNFIDVRFGPLSPLGDYHLKAGSPAVNRGLNSPLASYPELSLDIDGQRRPNGLRVDIGADERY